MTMASVDSRQTTTPGLWVTFADHCMDISLLAILFIAPLVLAGRHPWGKLALMLAVLPGTLGMLTKILAGKNLPLSNLRVGLLALCFFIPAAQTISWPSHWVESLTPGMGKLFSEDPLLISTDSLHQTLSVSPATTRRSMPMVVTYLCIFCFMVCRMDSLVALQRVLAILMISALFLTVLALLQVHFGNGRFMWFYDHPSRLPEDIPRGPFQNENHFSSLLATTLPVMLFFLFRKPHDPTRRTQKSLLSTTSLYRGLAAIACVTVICTVFATPSRGGAVIIAFAACLWPSILGWNWLGPRVEAAFSRKNGLRISRVQWLSIGAGLCCGILSIAGGFLYHSIESWSYWRAKIWAVDLQMWQDFPLLGIGVGNHPHVYRAYLDEYVSLTFSTGESSWLQFLVETGLIGTGLAVLIVMVVIGSLLRTLAHRTHTNTQLIICAVLAGLIASCTHAAIDFPWHIPTCFVVVLALVAIADRLPHLHHASHHHHTSQDPKYPSDNTTGPQSTASLSLAVGGLLMVGNLWAIANVLPAARAAKPWDDYRRLVRDQSDQESAQDDPEDLGSQAELQLLKQTLQIDPYHILARIKLVHYLSGELDRRRVELQDTTELAKLVLAQSRIAATVCPTESRSYLYASTALTALDAPIEQQQQLLRQSQRLRRVDGRVALRLGFNALLIQDEQTVQQQFQIALNDDPSYVSHVIKMLSVLYPADELIRRWSPCRDTAAEMFHQARLSGNESQLKAIGTYYCQRLLEDASAEQELSLVDHLLDSALTVAKQISNQPLQLQIASQRLELQPRNVSLILERALLHAALNDPHSAMVDLQTARKIAPHDSRIRRAAFEIDQAARPTLR